MKLMKYEKLDRLVRMDFDIVFDFRYWYQEYLNNFLIQLVIKQLISLILSVAIIWVPIVVINKSSCCFSSVAYCKC